MLCNALPQPRMGLVADLEAATEGVKLSALTRYGDECSVYIPFSSIVKIH